MIHRAGDKIWVGWIERGNVYIWKDEVFSSNSDGEIRLTDGGNGPWKILYVMDGVDDCVVLSKHKDVLKWAVDKMNAFIDSLKSGLNILDDIVETSGL